MKDGFDKSVAARMPKIQKNRPNRPWNVDPVQINRDEEIDTVKNTKAEAIEDCIPVQGTIPVQDTFEETAPVIEDKAEPVVIEDRTPDVQITSPAINASTPKIDLVATAKETISDLSTEFSNILYEKKDIQRQLEIKQQTIENTLKDNELLRARIDEMTRRAQLGEHLEGEIVFLNEQLHDAEFYIQNLSSIMDEKNNVLMNEIELRQEQEAKMRKMNLSFQDSAKLDVKVSIMTKDLNIAQTRVKELESQLNEEAIKRRPLEDEITELKKALDSVHSSLSQVRLKAKREAYGS